MVAIRFDSRCMRSSSVIVSSLSWFPWFCWILYRSQQYATAIYRSELALRLKDQGYDIERGKSGQPEIKGYTREYLDPSSPRSQQIQAYLEEHGVRGAGAAQIAAHQTRDDKLPAITHAEMQQKHRDMAAQFGQQPEQVIRAAHERRVEQEAPQKHQHLESPLNYAQEKNLARHAVTDECELMRDALKRSMGEASFADVRERFDTRVQSGDLIEVESLSPARAFTSEQMIGYERDTVAQRRGQNLDRPLVSAETWRQSIDVDSSVAASAFLGTNPTDEPITEGY
jgi:hypothetical protein